MPLVGNIVLIVNRGGININILESLFSLEHMIGWQLIPITVLFVTASYTDIKSFKIFNWNTGLLTLFNLFYFVVYPAVSGDYSLAIRHLVGGALSFSLLLGIAMQFMTKMGGDIKFSGAAGIAFGGIKAIVWVLLSAFVGGIHGAYKIKYQGSSVDGKIPFAPYFLVGAIIYFIIYLALFYGGVI